MTWRTKVPVVEAHIPAAAAGRRIARSPTRSTGAGFRDWEPQGDRFVMITKHGEDELFVGATLMNMSWGQDAIIITALVG
jgi:hypothetical protein